MQPEKTRHCPRCSIVELGGRTVIIDHHNNDRVIEPPCAADALAFHAFLKTSFRHGGHDAANDFLAAVADGKTPISDLVASAMAEKGFYK